MFQFALFYYNVYAIAAHNVLIPKRLVGIFYPKFAGIFSAVFYVIQDQLSEIIVWLVLAVMYKFIPNAGIYHTAAWRRSMSCVAR